MKKFLFTVGMLGALLCGLTTPVAAQTCGAGLCCEDWSIGDGKFTVGADWLYWEVTQDNLGFAVGTQVEAGTGIVNSRVLRPRHKYESGFRVGLGYELPCDCWDVGIIYTYFPSKAKRNFVAEPGEFITVDLGPFDLVDIDPLLLFSVDASRGKWSLTAQYLDLDVARTVCFGECFNFRPHIGARIYWMDQTLRFNGEFTDLDGSISLLSTKLKERFNGYGVEGGFWGDWKVGCGVSLIGHVGGALLYAKFRNKAEFGTSIPDTNDYCIRESFWTTTPMLDYYIGLQYADCFCDTYMRIRAGWEQHVLFDINHFERCGNFSTQGLTLGLDVAF
jgi:hypothetical protein